MFNKTKKTAINLAAAIAVTAALTTAASAGTSTDTSGQQLSGITDVLFELLEGSGGLLMALVGGGIAVFGITTGNIKLAVGGIVGGIASGVIAGIATSLHGAVL